MRISDLSSDVCSSDLSRRGRSPDLRPPANSCTGWSCFALQRAKALTIPSRSIRTRRGGGSKSPERFRRSGLFLCPVPQSRRERFRTPSDASRSEEHTSELQSLMRISYAVFCLKKKKQPNQPTHQHHLKLHIT